TKLGLVGSRSRMVTWPPARKRTQCRGDTDASASTRLFAGSRPTLVSVRSSGKAAPLEGPARATSVGTIAAHLYTRAIRRLSRKVCDGAIRTDWPIRTDSVFTARRL